MEIEKMKKRVEEMRNNMVRVLDRVHDLEALEDFANSIQLIMTESGSFDTIIIETQDAAFALTIDALSLE